MRVNTLLKIHISQKHLTIKAKFFCTKLNGPCDGIFCWISNEHKMSCLVLIINQEN